MKGVIASWFGSLGVGLATAIVGAALGGWIASRAVDWYSIPSREGGSGYFVLFQGLLAGVVGLVVGVIVSRAVVGAGGGQFRALVFAIGAHVALLAVIGVTARLRADVPPSFEGEELLLAVEVSWPEAQAPMLTRGKELPHVTLSALSGNTTRVSTNGPLFIDDARREDGRLIVPGAVEVFTSRGKRLLQVHVGTPGKVDGLLLPLPGYPGQKERDWSVWMPRARDGAPALPDGVRYRFKVVKRSEPIRAQTFGPFTVETVARSFRVATYDEREPTNEADAEFRLHFRGTPLLVEGRTLDQYEPDPWKPDEKPPVDSVVRYAHVTGVMVIPGAIPSLVAEVAYEDDRFRSSYYYLLRPSGERVQQQFVSPSLYGIRPHRLSAVVEPPDSVRSPAETRYVDAGYVDERTLTRPGLYLFMKGVVDTRTMQVTRVALDRSDDEITKLAPLSLSPDERTIARVRRGAAGDEQTGMLIEQITIASGARDTIPVGSARVPTGNWLDADRAFFDHYFEWVAGADGAYRVKPRASAPPMAPRGKVSHSGDYSEYRVTSAAASLRDAFVAELIASMRAERLPVEEGAYSLKLRIDGTEVSLSYGDDDHVAVWTSGRDSTHLVERVAQHLDSALATGRFSRHFKR